MKNVKKLYVLILIVLEVSLWASTIWATVTTRGVLILIVLEVSLWAAMETGSIDDFQVLILIVLEVSLWVNVLYLLL